MLMISLTSGAPAIVLPWWPPRLF